MRNDLNVRVLLVAEGSGGHLIPAFEVAQALAEQGVLVRVLYGSRPNTASFIHPDGRSFQTHALTLAPPANRLLRHLWRLWQAGRIWWMAHRQFKAFDPDVVVGFGGWFCVPMLLAARQAGIAVLVHEQNVRLGRANRFLLRHVDQVALSFPARPGCNGAGGETTGRELNGTPRVVTGLPIRRQIGTITRQEAARRLGLTPSAPTLLVLGGSQGSQAINHLLWQVVAHLTDMERTTWQVIHVAGMLEHAVVQQHYAAAGVKGLVVPHLLQMAEAYALADVVIARAGASTIAEVAHCRKPTIFIPYPYAGGHQRDNARLVESIGGGLWFEEDGVTPERLLWAVRRILSDERVRHRLTQQIHTLARPDATQRLAQAIVTLAASHA